MLNTTINERSLAANTLPVVELMSLHTGGGATQLLYHLTALAILPKSLGGKETCVVICDTDGTFNIKRLVQQLRLLLASHPRSEKVNINKAIIHPSLRHVHILRPQSLAALTASLDTLPTYFFNKHKHYSFDRAVGFIAIDSASAFYWQDRAETEDAAFFAKTSDGEEATQSGYVALAAVLKKTCAALQCPAIFTSWHLGPMAPTPYASRAFRPSLPAALVTMVTLRLVTQRIAVRKFPPLISVEGARREAESRIKAVEEGRFECFVNELGVEERLLRRMQKEGGWLFVFRILKDGVVFEERP